MKRIILNKITLIVLLFCTACGVSYEENPNEPTVAPTSGLLNGAQKKLLDVTRNEEFSGGQMLVWMQYWTNNIYTESTRFFYQEPNNLDGWNNIYAVAQDLVSIIEFNTNENTKYAVQVYGSNETQIAAARVMLVYTYLMAVELWGDVPYYSYGSTNPSFQANRLKEGISQASYASQEDIYSDMLQVLDETADVFENSDFVMKGDNFYQGNSNQWFLFTNSLRLRIANRVKHKLPQAMAFVEEAKNNSSLFMGSNGDNAGVTYEANATNGAPMYQTFQVDNHHYYGVSLSFVELLKGKSYDGENLEYFGADPRLECYTEKNSQGYFVGMPMVEGNSEAISFEEESEPTLSIIATPDRTLSYLDYAEVCFLLSEINDWDQDWYEEGARASMEQWGVEETAIQEALTSLSPASQETVLTQKYIALYMQPMEAWSEYRRTGYPKTLIAPNTSYTMTWPTKDEMGEEKLESRDFTFVPLVALTDLPYRNKYPINESNVNQENWEEAIEQMGGDTQDLKLWWMK